MPARKTNTAIDSTLPRLCVTTVIGSEPFTQIGYAPAYYYQLGTGYTAGLWPAANGGWFSFAGIIDEASIYNRALNASEVVGIFEAGGNGKCPVGSGLASQITSEAGDQLIPPHVPVEGAGTNQ